MITFRADHLERAEIDLVVVARELVLRLTPIADMKDLSLTLRGDPHVPYSGDLVLIQNAVRNLIDNAMKYSPAEGAIEVTVVLHPRPQIRVCDRGPGFPTDEIEALTTRFRRGANAANTIGSGLGLTIAREVAQAHGGQIELANQKGGGACVTLSF
jgi:two-component system sensor histidine kinase TctE